MDLINEDKQTNKQTNIHTNKNMRGGKSNIACLVAELLQTLFEATLWN